MPKSDSSRASRLLAPVSLMDHRLGSARAPITLVEYGDFECPYCSMAFQAVDFARAILGARLRYVFRNYPLVDIHPNALPAALVAEAAGAQGRYWEMHRLLYENQEALRLRDLLRYATELRLDLKKFSRDLHDPVAIERVRKEIKSGDRAGVQGTPAFFINGTLYTGAYDPAGLLAALQPAKRSLRDNNAA